MKIDSKAARAWLETQPQEGFVRSQTPQQFQQSESEIIEQHQHAMQALDEAIVSGSLVELLEQAQQSTGRSIRETGRRAEMSHTQLLSIKKQAERTEVRNLARVADAMGYELEIAFVPRDQKLKRLETVVTSQ
jgi:hypothetical protein